MKNLDLNAYGVSELSYSQTSDVNGGFLVELVILTAVVASIFLLGALSA